jgi:CRISPR/Cas system-associated endoribonuclease Cas2
MRASLLEPCGWLISYDVSDDRDRVRLARTLGATARRVLYSVFAAPPVPDREIAALVERCWELLDPGTDSLIAVPWCPDCALELLGLERSDGDELVVV